MIIYFAISAIKLKPRAARTPIIVVLHSDAFLLALLPSCTGVTLFIGSKVLCLFCFEICSPEGSGGEKGRGANFKTTYTEPLAQEITSRLYIGRVRGISKGFFSRCRREISGEIVDPLMAAKRPESQNSKEEPEKFGYLKSDCCCHRPHSFSPPNGGGCCS